jgi:hypothetical protein
LERGKWTWEELIAARVVKVEMGIHHVPDIFRFQFDRFHLSENSRPFISQGSKALASPHRAKAS